MISCLRVVESCARNVGGSNSEFYCSFDEARDKPLDEQWAAVSGQF